MSEAKPKEGGAGDLLRQGKGAHTSANDVSKSELISVCSECGAPLQYGSRDPCEGDYYWCPSCGAGPVIFPFGAGPRNPVPAIIDAELGPYVDQEMADIIADAAEKEVREIYESIQAEVDAEQDYLDQIAAARYAVVRR